MKGSAVAGGADASSIYKGDTPSYGLAGSHGDVGPAPYGMAYAFEKLHCPGIDGTGLTKKGLVCKAEPTERYGGYCVGHRSYYNKPQE